MRANDQSEARGDGAEALDGTPRARPGPGRPTPEQLALRNRELLERAFDMFLEKGFERTTIMDIGAAIGMTKRTVYRWYQDKTTLFKAALQHAIDQWVVPIDRLRAAETDDFEQSLLEIARILVDNAISPAGQRLMRITHLEAHRMPEAGAYTDEYGTRHTTAYLADLFRRRAQPGGADMPDAEPVALAFLSLVVGIPARSLSWGVPLDRDMVDENTRRYVRLFLHGLLHR